MNNICHKSVLVRSLIAAALFSLFTGCGQVAENLQPLSSLTVLDKPTGTVQADFCTDPAFDQKQYLKTVIILDHSGSNKQNYLLAADGSPALVNGTIQLGPQYATDPQGTLRYGNVATQGTLLNFLQNAPANDPADPTRFYALVDFSDDVTTYPSNASGFTSNIPDFFNHVQRDAQADGSAPDDDGSTNYLGALAAAYKIINGDVQAAQACANLPLGSSSPGAWCLKPGVAVASSYVVVFMSDGSPITDISGVGVDGSGNIVITGKITITKQSSVEILGQVGAMAALTGNAKFVSSLNFFTIYYYNAGNADVSAQQMMANMARAGNGIAYNALSGTNIDYTKFQPPTKRIKYSLSDVFVSNASTVWWTDGELHADTDMDGLPDDVETAWGSDPLNKYTDGNGVSDLVKYTVTHGKACAKKAASGLCADSVVDYKSGMCSSVRSSRKNGVLTYQASDPSGLNDCEKLVLNDAAGIGVPDSNGDIIPDWLEFINGLPFQAGTMPAINTPLQDGYTQYQKIKASLPLHTPTTQILNPTPAEYKLDLLSSTANQDCYHLTVTHLPVVGDGNTVRIDIVEKSELLRDSYLYRVGAKTFASGSNSVQFQDWNNANEIAAQTWKVLGP